MPPQAHAKIGGIKTFAVGHFSIGYILAKASSPMTKRGINLPLVFALSVIPDIDILFPFLQHRGPLHSIVLLTAVFIPLFIKYKAAAIPYYFALLQHPLIGDLIGGHVQLLWPFTTKYYGFNIAITSPLNIAAELLSFLLALLILFRSGDIHKLIKPNPSSLILLIPLLTVLLPSLLSFPLSVPIALLVPHLVYFSFFAISIASFALDRNARGDFEASLRERIAIARWKCTPRDRILERLEAS